MSCNGEDEGVENQFDRLPDDVVVHVFDHLVDAKCLCISSMVCNRFSLLTRRVHTASASFPHCKFPSPKSLPTRLFDFFVAKPFDYLHHHLVPSSSVTKPPTPSPYAAEGPIVKFLSRMEGIESLQLEFPPISNMAVGSRDSLLKWGAKFGARFESFTYLSLTSLHRSQTSENEAQMRRENEAENGLRRLLNRYQLRHQACLASHLFQDAVVRHSLLVAFVKRRPMLSSISIADMKGWGRRMRVSGEGLVRLRDSIKSTDDLSSPLFDRSLKPKVCYLPLLRLPLSGYVIEGVTLVLIECGGGGGGGDGDGDERVIVDSFAGEEEEEGEEEGVYGEAVAEIFAHHREKIEEMADLNVWRP